MASTRTFLNRSERQLKRMAQDLEAMLQRGTLNWREKLSAPATLGEGLEITPWRFAFTFFSTLREWRFGIDGWRRFYSKHREPRQWEKTETRCSALARDLLSRSELQEAILVGEVSELVAGGYYPSPASSADKIFGHILALRERMHVFAMLKASPGWKFADSTASRQELFRSRIESCIADLTPEIAATLDWHLRQYRSALLLAESLHPEGTGFWPSRFKTHFENTMNKIDIITSLDEAARQRLSDHPELLRAVERLIDLCGELGFDNLCEHLTGDDFSAANTGVLQFPMNVIPGTHSGACCQLVTVLARVAGKKNAESRFRQLMTQLKTHLLRCDGMTKLAVLITDWWDATVFEQEHAAELAEWRRKGVDIVVLIVSQPNASPTPLRIRW